MTVWLQAEVRERGLALWPRLFFNVLVNINFTSRAFSADGPAWNYLPPDLRQPDLSYILDCR